MKKASVRTGGLAVAAALVTAAAISVSAAERVDSKPRNYDARIEANRGVKASPGVAQRQAVERLRASVSDLAVTYDEATGATRTLMNRVETLTGPDASRDPLEIASRFATDNPTLLGLTEADLLGYEVGKAITSEVTGIAHLHLVQRLDGIPVYNGEINVNVAKDGRILNVNNLFVPGLARALNASEPRISAAAAVERAAEHLEIAMKGAPELLSDASGGDAQQTTRLRAPELSTAEIEARLMILPIRRGEARLVWNFQVQTHDRNHWYDMNVDAADGKVWTRFDWVASDQYRVYAPPVESPNHTVPWNQPPTPLPPTNGPRTLAINPANATASPFGWHDTNGVAGAEFTVTNGNNVVACTDIDANNACDAGSSPDCGGALNCDFPLDLTQAPSTYRPAAVTNLFYINNVLHDIHYQYGFTSAFGNFQENTYGLGGIGSDNVNADAQDGSGFNNANFGTPSDGSNPRMQMYLWNAPTPDKDGDLDNGIIVHEYGHGVSNRLVGNSVSCLGNNQQPGEGISDWFSLTLSHEVGDAGTNPRGIGTYALNQAVDGPGIRTQRYSTDPAINTWTYQNVAGSVIPHGVGEKWAQGMWEVYWALVDQYGFDPNFYNAAGGAGNQRAMLYHMQGLSNCICSPAFTDVRDSIIAAAQAVHPEDVCLLWQAFAGYGLGSDAVSGGPNSTNPINGFQIPVTCQFLSSTTPIQTVCAGQDATFPITVGSAFTASTTLSATGNPGATTTGFVPNPVPLPHPANSILTVGNTGGVATGSYVITVHGTDGTNSNDYPVTLNVSAGAPGATSLTAPANGATGVSTSPTFTWTAVSGAVNYVLEVDNDVAFGSIDYTATVAGTSHTVAAPLSPNTVYYWRVRSQNPCGSGPNSTVFQFTTANQICIQPNLAIPDNVPAGVNSDMVVSVPGNVTDMNVSFLGTHTFVGDLIFRVSKIGGPGPVIVINRPLNGTGGCASNDFNVTLDDEAAGGPVQNVCNAASPALDGVRTPNAPLTAFDGTALTGTWRFNIADVAGVDVGVVQQWCLIPQTDDLIFADSFASGNMAAWGSSVTGGGALSVTAAANMEGAGFGLQADGFADPIYVQDDTPNNEGHYRSRIYINRNTYALTLNGREVPVLIGYKAGSPAKEVVSVLLRRQDPDYQIVVSTQRDDGTYARTTAGTLAAGPHFVEIDWRRATAPGANNGSVELFVDGVSIQNLGGLDSDTQGIDFARLGTFGQRGLSGARQTPTGTLFLDGFVSRRNTYVGP